MKGIVWRPNTLDFLRGCDDGSFRLWRLLDMAGKVSMRLVWSSGLAVFVATDAVITDTIGHSTINRLLLKQRGPSTDLCLLDVVDKRNNRVRGIWNKIKLSHNLINDNPSTQAIKEKRITRNNAPVPFLDNEKPYWFQTESFFWPRI